MTLQSTEFSDLKHRYRGPFAPVASSDRSALPPLQGKENTADDDSAAQKFRNLIALFNTRPFEQHFQPDSTILLHGEPANAVYMIVSGTVRGCSINADGCRQIFRFSRKGDFFGLSDIDRWHFTAEAADHVIVKSIPRATFERELSENCALQGELRTYFRDLLKTRDRQLLTLVSTNATDRLYQFLREFAASRPSGGHVTLPMCRRDIADHLGLTPETVSRAFGNLRRKGLIELLTPEKYRINDPAGQGASPR